MPAPRRRVTASTASLAVSPGMNRSTTDLVSGVLVRASRTALLPDRARIGLRNRNIVTLRGPVLPDPADRTRITGLLSPSQHAP